MRLIASLLTCFLLVGDVQGNWEGSLQRVLSYPGTCHKQLQGSGYFAIPNNESCLYTMNVDADEVVSLYLNYYFPYCLNDNNNTGVSVHDGPDNLAPILSTFSCGYNTAGLVSTNSTLSVYYFQSSNNYSYSYVYISFHASPASSRCGGRLDAQSMMLTSPNYPHNYEYNSSCTWEVYTPPGYMIFLYINDFEVLDEPGADRTRSHNRQCDHDSLTVLENDKGSSSVVTRLCGILPASQVSTIGNMTLQFTSDGSGNGRGFSLRFYRSENVCGGTLEGTNGTFGSNYGYQSCYWHITVPEGSVVHINASLICSWDSYYEWAIYDGDSTFAPILSQRHGYYDWECAPFSVKSTGNSVFIRYYGGAFTATYTAVAADQSFDCDFNGGFCGWGSWSEDVFHWDIVDSRSYPSYDGSPFTGVRMRSQPRNVTQLKSHLLSPVLQPFNGTRCFRFKFGPYNSASLTLRDASGRGGMVADGNLPLLWRPSLLNIADVGGDQQQWSQAFVNISADVTQVLFETTSSVIETLAGIDNVELNPEACPSDDVCYEAVNADDGVLVANPSDGNMTSSCFWEITVSTGKIIQFQLNPNLIYDSYCASFYNVKNGSLSLMYPSYYSPNPYQYYSSENQLIVRFNKGCSNNSSYIIGNFTAINPNDIFGCGGILNNTYGWISSPNYPNDYSYNMHCEWRFEAPDDAEIYIYFYGVDIEESDGCTADSLQIYNESATVPDRLCGTNVYRSVTLTSTARIVFTSDGQNEGRGFEMYYRVSVPCGGNMSGWQGSISTPYYGGVDNQYCVWTIDTPPNTIIKLSFQQFSMSYEYKIDIYDGASLEAPYLGRFSGYIVPPPILSTGNSLYLSFYSPNSYYYPTFNIFYEAMKIERVAVLQSPGRISSGDVTPFYNDTLFFVWEVNAGPGLNVKLNFSSLRLEEDPLCLNESLTVYDGWRSPNTSLGSFCGSRLPPSVRSTSSSLQLLLRLRNNRPWKGFDLSFLETSQVPSMKGCGVQYSAGGRDRIVGGTPATSGKWPWQASLRNYGSHVCGASLISERWLVAAAHCFMYSSNVYEWQVYLGITYIYDSANAVIVNVAQIITHERFNISTIDYDIALVRLSDPVSFNHRVSPICLPPSTSHFPQPGKTCFISGWGRTSLAESGIHYDLLEAPMQIFSHEACSSNLMNGDLITTRMICIGHPAGAISSCQGDSGGPLACQGTDKAWYLSGVTSWGFGCAFPMKPVVYTKTSKFLPWIKRYTDLP
ncbi:uncharacterized protein LOC144719985 [Lampetra planeri]